MTTPIVEVSKELVEVLDSIETASGCPGKIFPPKYAGICIEHPERKRIVETAKMNDVLDGLSLLNISIDSPKSIADKNSHTNK